MGNSLFRYSSEFFAARLIESGEVCFNSIAYFRDIEDGEARGDRHDGTFVFRPPEGLGLADKNGNPLAWPVSQFEASARGDYVFVYCLSTENSTAIASRFSAPVCVEILKPAMFISLIRGALQRRRELKKAVLLNEPVRYYTQEELPKETWALPDRLTICKPKIFEWQKEYRIAFAINNAFGFEQGDYKLTAGQSEKTKRENYPRHILKLGNLKRICRLHRFV